MAKAKSDSKTGRSFVFGMEMVQAKATPSHLQMGANALFKQMLLLKNQNAKPLPRLPQGGGAIASQTTHWVGKSIDPSLNKLPSHLGRAGG
jgi:hypothetical protein